MSTHEFIHDGQRLVYDDFGSGRDVVVLLPGLLLSRKMQEPQSRRSVCWGWSELHQAGSTIFVVTHDRCCPGHAAKEMHIFHGRVLKS